MSGKCVPKETPEVETVPDVAADAPEPDVPDVYGLRDYGFDLRGLRGTPDLSHVEEAVTALLVDALPAPPLSVRCRLDGETMRVTVTLPGRLASINTTVRVAPKEEP